MPVNINQLNASGLAQLSGGASIPNLGLKPYGITAEPGTINLQAALEAAKLQQMRDTAQQQNALGMFTQQQENARNQNTVQGSLMGNRMAADASILGHQITQQNSALDRQQKAQEAEQKYGLDVAKLGVDQQTANQLGQYQQGQLQNNQEKNQIDALHNALQDRAKLTEQEREKKSAFASAYLTTAQTLDPAKREDFDKWYVSQGVKHGDMSQEDADQFLKLAPEQRVAMATMDYSLTQKAGELSKLMNQQGQTGGVTVTQPDGTVVQVQAPNKGTATQLQESVVGQQVSQSTLDSIEKRVNELQKDPTTKEIFTRKGNLDLALSVAGEYNESIPGVGTAVNAVARAVTGKTPEERKDYIKKVDAVNTSITQLFNAYRKDITGAAASEQELKRLEEAYLNKDMSASQFVSRMKTIRDAGLRELGIKQKALSQGVEVSSKPTESQYSQEDLEHTAKLHNISVDEVKKRLGA